MIEFISQELLPLNVLISFINPDFNTSTTLPLTNG